MVVKNRVSNPHTFFWPFDRLVLEMWNKIKKIKNEIEEKKSKININKNKLNKIVFY